MYLYAYNIICTIYSLCQRITAFMAHQWQGARNKTAVKKKPNQKHRYFFYYICIFEHWMLGGRWVMGPHRDAIIGVRGAEDTLLLFFSATAAYLLKLFGQLCLPNFNSWLFGNGAALANFTKPEHRFFFFCFVCELSLCVCFLFCPAISIWTKSLLSFFFRFLLSFIFYWI